MSRAGAIPGSMTQEPRSRLTCLNYFILPFMCCHGPEPVLLTFGRPGLQIVARNDKGVLIFEAMQGAPPGGLLETKAAELQPEGKSQWEHMQSCDLWRKSCNHWPDDSLPLHPLVLVRSLQGADRVNPPCEHPCRGTCWGWRW